MVVKSFKLRSGAEIPSIGLGTWALNGEEGYNAILYALKHGYKMLDAAYSYFNQDYVGKAIKESGVKREDIFIVDKLANSWHTAAEECLDITMKNLDCGYLDLWLMHWPSPLNHHGNDPKTPTLPDGSVDFEKNWTYVDTWKKMIEIQKNKPEIIKHIGVSNFSIEELENIINETGVIPEVNEVELHPSNNQQELYKYCQSKGILLVGYSPLGSSESTFFTNPELKEIAEKRGISIAQILLSWGVAQGWPVIPRSQNPARLSANLDLVDLTEDEIAKVTAIGNAHKRRFVLASWHTFSD